MNSASSKFTDGLANSSGQVGRNYMRHMTGSVYAVFDQPVHMYRGTTMAGIVRDEARFDTKRGFVGGYELETLSLGLPFMAAFLNPGAWGREFTSALDGSRLDDQGYEALSRTVMVRVGGIGEWATGEFYALHVGDRMIAVRFTDTVPPSGLSSPCNL